MADGDTEDMGNFINKDNGGSDVEENFPDTLEGFGYKFNAEGQLRDNDGNPFTFKVKENHYFNQKRYEAIGRIMDQHIYHLLEDEGLKRIHMPADAPKEVGQSFIFASDDALSNPNKLMVLIHGAGVVKAGQWARKLIINDGLEYGTQLPYIKRAIQEGYGIAILNSNLNTFICNGEENPIEGHDTPEAHGLSVWNLFITKAKAKDIVIVAHSYGGIVSTETAIKAEQDFLARVTAVAFTDSIHSIMMEEATSGVTNFYLQAARNWISSDEPLDTPIALRGAGADAPRVSAGNSIHEWTSSSAMDSVFKFFTEKIAKSDKVAQSGETSGDMNVEEDDVAAGLSGQQVETAIEVVEGMGDSEVGMEVDQTTCSGEAVNGEKLVASSSDAAKDMLKQDAAATPKETTTSGSHEGEMEGELGGLVEETQQEGLGEDNVDASSSDAKPETVVDGADSAEETTTLGSHEGEMEGESGGRVEETQREELGEDNVDASCSDTKPEPIVDGANSTEDIPKSEL